MKTCSIKKCNKRHHARSWCREHYRRWHRYGDPLGFYDWTNEIERDGDDIWIKLTRGQWTVIDAEDYPKVKDYRWIAAYSPSNDSFYTLAGHEGTTIRMHRIIMNTPKGQDTDHVNHDTLDNRKANLRICTRAQNQWNRRISSNNTSGFKGVCWDRCVKQYRAYINSGGRKKHLGLFRTAEEAAEAYAKAADKIFGAFNYNEEDDYDAA